jgi:hypothetical protein
MQPGLVVWSQYSPVQSGPGPFAVHRTGPQNTTHYGALSNNVAELAAAVAAAASVWDRIWRGRWGTLGGVLSGDVPVGLSCLG